MRISIEFRLQDMWIGAFWRKDSAYQRYYLWICLLPCLPILITWDYTRKEAKRLARAIYQSGLFKEKHGMTGCGHTRS